MFTLSQIFELRNTLSSKLYSNIALELRVRLGWGLGH